MYRTFPALSRTIACLALYSAVGLWTCHASAQNKQDAANARPHVVASATGASEGNGTLADQGSKIYIVDDNDNLATINLKTKVVNIIGNTGVLLTELAFYPKTHELYGISFSGLYKVNLRTAKATLIANTSGTELNALYISASGTAYVEGPTDSNLYTLNLQTGAETLVGSSNGYLSAGDICYYNGSLLMSTTSNDVVAINAATGAATSPVAVKLSNVFGLVSISKAQLYAFSGSAVYKLGHVAAGRKAKTTLIVDMASQGIGTVYGAAHYGPFGP